MKPILTYGDREFFSEAKLKQRVAELDLENSGAVMPKAARAEWNTINATIAEFEARVSGSPSWPATRETSSTATTGLGCEPNDEDGCRRIPGSTRKHQG